MKLYYVTKSLTFLHKRNERLRLRKQQQQQKQQLKLIDQQQKTWTNTETLGMEPNLHQMAIYFPVQGLKSPITSLSWFY